MKSLLLLFLLLPFLAFPQCPVITQQPRSQADCDGNSIRMIVLSNGTSFQWEKKRPQDPNFTNISGATQAHYQIMPTGNTAHPSGTQYRIKVGIGSCYVYSEPASIQLRKINSIVNPSICERGSGILESIQTEGATRYQWMRSINGGPFLDLADDLVIQGTQQNQLRITQATANLDGQKFKIRIDFSVSPNNDNEGSTQNLNQTPTCPRTSSEITLQIKTSPTPRHAASSYTGCINQAIAVNSTGCSPYTTQWYDAQGNPAGTGARLLVTLPDELPRNYYATCINAGCESLPSSGTQAQAFPKPQAPQNAGTLAEICVGLPLTFKASGGSNNIWYVNGTSTSPVSTATNYTVLASGSGQITRFVSQSIRGCESDRTAISVNVLSGNNCNPTDNGNNPPPPDNPPPIVPPSDPEPPSKLLPSATLAYQVIQHCESARYAIQVRGCPNTPIWKINEALTHQGDNYETLAPDNLAIHIECPESISVPLDFQLAGLSPPEIHLLTNYHDFVCEADKTYLSIQIPPGATLLAWEFNGHSFSEQVTLHETLAAGNYQALVQRNSCIYRSEFLTIEVHHRPEPPLLSTSKNNICEGDSSTIEINSPHRFYLWNGRQGDARLFFFETQPGTYPFYAQVSDDGVCWSHASKILHLRIFPTPVTPRILVAKNGGFCKGDSVQLRLDQSGIGYQWSTKETQAYVYSHLPGSYQVRWQDSTGCWSQPSNSFQTYYYPEEPQPHIRVSNRQFCLGEIVTLYASPAFEYHWSNQQHNDSVVLRNSEVITLKTRNQYGCWSPSSLALEVIAQENPWMPKLIRSGMYFIRAMNQDEVTHYEWKWDRKALADTASQIKMKQSGIFQVRAKRTYRIQNAHEIHCFSAYQQASFGIPTDDPGVQVYPNPNKGERIQVEIQENLNNVQVDLYSLQGNRIKHWQLSDTMHIQILSLADIQSGSYIMVMYTSTWAKQKRIFIVSD